MTCCSCSWMHQLIQRKRNSVSRTPEQHHPAVCTSNLHKINHDMLRSYSGMFRPISMVVPDSSMIAEIILFAEGFNNTKVLAKKVHALYCLAVQQLSKQDHYDFGLRGLTSLLRYAGKKKRSNPSFSDEEVWKLLTYLSIGCFSS